MAGTPPGFDDPVSAVLATVPGIQVVTDSSCAVAQVSGDGSRITVHPDVWVMDPWHTAAVLAHEVSHVTCGHVAARRLRLRLVLSLLALALGFAVLYALAGFVVSIVALAAAATVDTLVGSWACRRREFVADRRAADLLTRLGKPGPRLMAETLTAASRGRLVLPVRPDAALAGSRLGYLVSMLRWFWAAATASHPPLSARVKALAFQTC